MPLEQLGKQPHHHLAVRQHVGHAGRHAQVVLQHIELAVAVADQVDPDDVGIGLVRHLHPHHRDLVLLVDQDMVGGDQARPQNVLLVIDVREETVDRLHPLGEPQLEPAPVVRIDDPRHHVRRYQPFRAGVVAVDREGDAGAAKDQICLGALARHPLRGPGLQPFLVRGIVLANGTVRQQHFVVTARRGRYQVQSRLFGRRLGRRRHPAAYLGRYLHCGRLQFPYRARACSWSSKPCSAATRCWRCSMAESKNSSTRPHCRQTRWS